MVRVENKLTYKGPGVYIGRPSKWGNPFVLGRHGTREQVIEAYEVFARKAIKPEWLDELRDAEALICWCAPLPCHGDVLVRLIEETS